MRLFTLVSQLRGQQEIRRLGQEVAKRCQPLVTPHALVAGGSMTLPELRGYLRARAGSLVKQHAAVTLRDLGVTDMVWHVEVTAHALELVIQAAIANLVKSSARSSVRNHASIVIPARRAA